jgi:hypothetical protein
MGKQILGEVKDTNGRYVARAVVEERAIMPGYQFYVEIQREGNPTVKKVKVGKMSAGTFGLINYPPVWNGVRNIEDMQFDEDGLTIRFLKGLWGAGLDEMLGKEHRFVPRASFA